MNTLDRKFMRRALALARNAIGLASPNPSVGCVIARNDKIVGEGWHEYLARDHAEVRALADAADHARGATAYVTLEPCAHFGRTPPCASALIEAGVRRVVVAQLDPNPLVCGKGISRMQAAGIDVEVGPLHLEAARIIEPFACHVTTGLPLVVGKVGMSMDGRIAAAGNPGGWITSEESREFSQELRLQLDAVLVGIGTVLADDPRLSYRGKRPKARPLWAVVLDSRLRTPVSSRLLHAGAASRILIFCRPEASKVRRRALEAEGAEILPVEYAPHGLNLKQILRELGKRGVLGLLVEGGSEVHWSFLSENLVDKFFLVTAPILLGGDGAVPAVGGAGYESAAAAPRFRIRRTFHSGPDLVLEAYPSYSRSILSPWRSDVTP